MSRARPLAVAALAACALVATAAAADTPPSRWDEARDPGAREAWSLHVRVERLLHAHAQDPTGLALESEHEHELHCEAALAMLEEASAAQSADVRLRFDLGLVLFELAEVRGRVDLYTKAADVLTGAVAAAPDAPAATEALERIVYAYAKLDRPKDELAAWHRYIPRILDPRSRTVAEMNMGEAEMRLGQVDDAILTLREVLRASSELPNTSSTYVLTLWDLAVALDRAGDPRGALETAGRAARETAINSRGVPSSGRMLLTRDPAVFFVPAWERQWYLALGSTALAQADPDAREAVAYLLEAEHEWDTYIVQALAAGGGDRWLPIARARAARVHAMRLAAQKRVPKGTTLPVGAEDD